jgi:hypothetical protein
MKAAHAVGGRAGQRGHKTLTRPGGWYGVRECVPALNAYGWMEEHLSCAVEYGVRYGSFYQWASVCARSKYKS